MKKRSPIGVLPGSGARNARCLGLVVCAGLAAPALGANIVWEGGTAGAYLTAANWAGGMVPGFSDTLVLNTRPSMEIDFTEDIETGRVLHNDGDLFLELNGFTLDLRVASSVTESWTSGVNIADGGDVHVNGGRLLCNYAGIANNMNQRSAIILDDADAVFESRQSTRVGSFGTGSMSLSNKASLVVGNDLVVGETAFGDGVLALFDEGTTVDVNDQIQIGALGDGILRINPGTTVSCLEFFAAAFEFSVGEITIFGPDALLAVGTAAGVGFEGSAELDVNAGATFSMQQLRIGFAQFSSGIIRVQGDGALLDVSTDVLIGSSGSGQLIIRNGGRGDIGELSMTSANAIALTRVQGETSRLDIRDELRVGSLGDGLLEIVDDAVVTADNVEVNPAGLINLDRGNLEFTSMIIAGAGVGETGARGGPAPTSGLAGNGTLVGDIICRGPISPGPEHVTLPIDGSLTFSETAELNIDFRMPGVGGETSDALSVTGDVVLGGTLRMERGSSAVSPFLLQSLTIISSDSSVSGQFDDAEIDQPTVNPLRLIIVNTGTGVDVVATILGDVTGDAIVDSSDIASLLAGWETSEPNADFNDDGVVDSTDLATMLAAWSK